jgi:hypothetical protein
MCAPQAALAKASRVTSCFQEQGIPTLASCAKKVTLSQAIKQGGRAKTGLTLLMARFLLVLNVQQETNCRPDLPTLRSIT